MEQLRELFVGHIWWAYECLEMQGIMAEHGVREAEGIWNRIGTIVAEYSYLQITKIHDPAGSDKNANLSLDWFIYKCLGTKRARLLYQDFKQKNQDFLTSVKVARHKVVSHSDQNTYKQGKRVGAYAEGLDDQYFDTLHTLISECYQEQDWGPFPEWPKFIRGDTERFMKKLCKAFAGS